MTAYSWTTVLIFLWVYVAMIAMAFWESYVEGRSPGAKRALGWTMGMGRYSFHAYHFDVFVVMWPVLLTLPLVIYGWNTELFGILLSAYFSGIVLEDFLWYVVNPAASLKDFNPRFARHYPWIKMGRLQVPLLYVVMLFVSALSWYFIWR